MNAAASPPINIAADDFTLFGLPKRFGLDRAALDALWRGVQSQVHPDRFVNESAQAQRIAMQWSVRVNEAYQRLKDPLQRAAYLCALQGAPIDAERNTAMPLAFLQHQMAWREALDEAADDESLEDLEQEVRATRQTLLTSMAQALDVDGDASKAAADVRACMFVDKFLADVEKRREALAS